MSKRIDEKMLLRAEPILEKNKTIDDLENIKIEINLLDKDRKTLTSKPLKKIIPKAEKTEDIKDILKKYNSTFNGKYIIKDITSAKEVAKQLEIEETDEKYNQISYLSFRIDANCSGKFDKSEAEKWFDVEICQFQLTADDLKQIFPNSEQIRREETAKAFNNYYCEFEINTLDRVAHFLGQIGAETGELKFLEEDPNYNEKNIFDTYLKPSTIIHPTEKGERTYKYHALLDGYDVDLSSCPIQVQDDSSYGHNRVSNPIVINQNWTYNDFKNAGYSIKNEYIKNKSLFDYVYGCRMGNGGKPTKDGSSYFGVGFIHLTGKDQYKNIHNYWNKNYPNDKKNFLGQDIELLTTDIDVAMKSAMIFWSKIKKLNSLATSKEKVKEVTYKVNGGYNNLENRKRFTNKAYEVLKAKMEIK